jgi:CBS domain-containing protein
MKTLTVKDLMVPISEYATVSEDATLYEAVQELEKAQEEFDSTRYRHRAVLILGNEGRVVGKISQIDVLKALEPKYQEISETGAAHRYGFTKKFMSSMLTHYRLWDSPLKDICRKAGERRVVDFMQPPTEGEYADIDATLDEAIHQLVLGNHQSLLVTEREKIEGILRLTDVFAAIFHTMKECSID